MGGETLMEDEVRYRLPFALVGRLAHFVVRRQLRRIFRYREQVIRSLLD
jgi:ligand-binding SRPBCC domain-containing protein